MIYLDNAASTCPKFHASTYAQYWMNPNSPHKGGLEANRALARAKDKIKQVLGVSGGVVAIGGTASQLFERLMERINWLYTNYYICGSYYEHNSIEQFIQGHTDWEDIQDIQEWIEPNTVLCWMMINNITGTCFPVEEIGKLCHKYNAFYIMDITAALGHYPISSNLESFCDCIFASGHKIHAEKGIGFMWLSDRFASFLELPNDPHDEYGMITGTPNVPGALALADAVEYAVDNVKTNAKHWELLTYHMLHQLHRQGIEAKVWNLTEPKTDAINAITLPGINADALVQYLSSKGIYISPGHSACSNDATNASRVLEAFGLTKEQASQTVRVSFSEDTTEEDIEALVKGIVEFKNLFI